MKLNTNNKTNIWLTVLVLKADHESRLQIFSVKLLIKNIHNFFPLQEAAALLLYNEAIAHENTDNKELLVEKLLEVLNTELIKEACWCIIWFIFRIVPHGQNVSVSDMHELSLLTLHQTWIDLWCKFFLYVLWNTLFAFIKITASVFLLNFVTFSIILHFYCIFYNIRILFLLFLFDLILTIKKCFLGTRVAKRRGSTGWAPCTVFEVQCAQKVSNDLWKMWK